MVKKYIVTLSEVEQAELHNLIQRRNEKATAVKRAYVLLAADRNGQDLCDSEIALRYQMTIRAIEDIRRRFVEEGFADTVYGRKRMKEWVISEASAEFVCAMEEVLDVYERPYQQNCPVVCLDGSPHQLISETRQGFMDSQAVKHVDYEYKREGVAEIYMIAEPKAGKRFIELADSHDSHQWAKVVAHIAEKLYGEAERITLVQDNLSAHRKAALYEVFDAQRARAILRRIEFVYTPKHGSWLNVAEIKLSVLKSVALKQRMESKAKLQKQIGAYLREKNSVSKAVNWQFKTKNARIKLKRLYPNP